MGFWPSTPVNMTAVKAGLCLRSFLWRAHTRVWSSLALVLWLAAGRASPSEAEGAAFVSFASASRSGCAPSSAPQLCFSSRSPWPPRAPAERHRLLPLLRMGASGRGGGGRTEGAEAGSADTACALDAMCLSRRSALGVGFVGLLAVAAAPDASGALEAAAVVAGPAAGAAKKEAKPLASTLGELLKPAPPNKAAEAAKKEAKIANEMKTVDTELRKEYM